MTSQEQSTGASNATGQQQVHTISYPHQRAAFPYVDVNKCTPEVVEAFKVLPFESNVLKLVAHAEGFFPAISQLLGAMFRSTRQLPTMEWQLVVLRTASLIRAHYVFEVNSRTALAMGMPNAKRLLIAFGSIDDAEFFTVRDRLLLQFVQELIETNNVSEGLLGELKAAFTTREIFEVIIIVGLYSMLGRVTIVGRIDTDPEIPGRLDAIKKLASEIE
jgi:alkylhydroperoxidase family enzyme